MLALSRRKKIDLSAARLERARILALHAEQQNLRHIAKIKPDAAAIRAPVFPDFVPDDVGLVEKSPCSQDRQALRQQRIWDPKIEMRDTRRDVANRQLFDFLKTQCFISIQPSMFGSDFAGLVIESPWWISQNG